MKQGLSLRISQHLALTPQLQQSIRLLQLSTLELSQEVEQMLDENPFLELSEEAAEREEFGLEHVNTPVSQAIQEFESATDSIAGPAYESSTTASNESETTPEISSEPKLEDSWEGDGSVESAADDSEWGGEAPARKNNNDEGDTEASDLARDHESLQDHLHRQSLSLRLSSIDRAALHFLIESLNDDGYLEDSLAFLASGLAKGDIHQTEELEQHFAMALKLLHHMEPAGVGARRQKNFFSHGELAMHPLVLREIADELGLHESTISRVTTAKYMNTPFGTFELKYFFGSALGTETGGNASSTAVRALIKQFVAAESLKKPLSDNQISEMLKEQGIECARRTVAKYREALRIAPTNLRKSL